MSKIIAKCWAKVFGKDRGERIFVLTAVILPLMQFFLFYVCVNFNQIIMSFQKYEGTSDVAEWAWFDSIRDDLRFAVQLGRLRKKKEELKQYFELHENDIKE